MQVAAVSHDPFPAAFVQSVFPEDEYAALVADFPPLSAFRYCSALGHKFLLRDEDGAASRRSNAWLSFRDRVIDGSFAATVIRALSRSGFPLRCRQAEARCAGRRPAIERTTCVLEFAILPPDGGHHFPHVDNPRKIAAIILPMIHVGEWQPDWGGNTTMYQPKTRKLSSKTRYLTFDEVMAVRSFPFVPNSGVVLLRTPQAWHGVPPLSGLPREVLRRTAAVNIIRSQ